jgi:hypothetical protein
MNTFFSSILAAVRAWLGLDQERPYPSHGWLLRAPALARVRPAPTARGTRR